MCKGVFYCKIKCQKHHWLEHKPNCSVFLDAQLATKRKEDGNDSPEVGRASFALGTVCQTHGRYAEAAGWFTESARIFRFVREHEVVPMRDTLQDLASSLQNRGQAYFCDGMYKKARESFNLAMWERKRLDPSGVDGQTGKLLSSIAQVCARQGKNDEAMDKFEDALSILVKFHGGEEHMDVAMVLSNMSGLYDRTGSRDTAIKCLNKAIGIHTRCGTGPEQNVALSFISMASYHMQDNNLEDALDVLKKALVILRQRHGEKHPEIARALFTLGQVCPRVFSRVLYPRAGYLTIPDPSPQVYMRQNELEKALKVHRKALKYRQRTLPLGHVCLADSMSAVADLQKELDALALSSAEDA
jgi:tetratricopeptide (TPR) repeat protein